jgi:hypothetical protein
MASKRRIRRKQCGNKQSYSIEKAILAAKIVGRKSRGKVSHYKCGFCGNYHIGHTPKKTYKAQLQSKRDKALN